MRAYFIYESLNKFQTMKNPKIKWDWTFKNEKIIDVFKYKGIPVKVVRTGNNPIRYYAIPSLGEHDRPMTYYNLKTAINRVKNDIDIYTHFIEENMQTPLSHADKNKPISQKYPLENPNYLGDSADDNKNKKIKRRMKKIVKESLNEDLLNTLSSLSIGYLSGFALSQIFKWIKKEIKNNEEWKEAKETISDLINLIGEKNSTFKVIEFGDRYYLTPQDKELQKEIGDIRVFKKYSLINVLEHDIVLLSEEHEKLIDLLKLKTQNEK